MKKLIITADDFGLSESINLGIAEAYRKGVVTAASLLINAPATSQAIQLASENPGLEIGLHLGIVESFSASQNPRLLTPRPYWEGCCLPRDWKEFLLGDYFFYQELWYHEFDLQIRQFLQSFEKMPFINSTQHLHLLPYFQPMLHQLSLKYKISYVRVGKKLISSSLLNKRPIQSCGIKVLSKLFKTKGLKTVDTLLGSDQAGHLTEEAILKLLRKVPTGVSELIVHPGLPDSALKRALPKTYTNYGWEQELAALVSDAVRQQLGQEKITLTNFSAI